AESGAAARAGCERVGIDVPSHLAHEANGVAPEEVRDQLHADAISCYEIVPLSINDDREAVAAAASTVRRLAVAVDAQHVLATVRTPVSDAVADNLRMAADVLGEVGVAVSVEFMPTSPLASLEDAVDLVETASDDRVGIV